MHEEADVAAAIADSSIDVDLPLSRLGKSLLMLLKLEYAVAGYQ